MVVMTGWKKDRRISMRRCAIVAGLALLLATPAHASGYSANPEYREKLKNHSLCLARLKEREASDSAAVSPELTAADGSTKKIVLEKKSKGVEASGRQKARYEARLWYVHGRPRPEIEKMEYRSSWEESRLECSGRTLITNSARGFAQSSFEPLPAKK
jgi:hypothetical protein